MKIISIQRFENLTLIDNKYAIITRGDNKLAVYNIDSNEWIESNFDSEEDIENFLRINTASNGKVVIKTLISDIDTEIKENLYLVTTIGNYKAYVVAASPDIAYQKFRKSLDDKNYGYVSNRDLKEITVITSDYYKRDKYNNTYLIK